MISATTPDPIGDGAARADADAHIHARVGGAALGRGRWVGPRAQGRRSICMRGPVGDAVAFTFMTLGTRPAAMAAGYMCLDDLAPRARRLVGVVLAIGVATTGWSVVYLGAHRVTDVLVGWVLGAALGVGVGLAARRLPIGRRPPDEGDRPG